jgi:hypothetical protein
MFVASLGRYAVTTCRHEPLRTFFALSIQGLSEYGLAVRIATANKSGRMFVYCCFVNLRRNRLARTDLYVDSTYDGISYETMQRINQACTASWKASEVLIQNFRSIATCHRIS